MSANTQNKWKEREVGALWKKTATSTGNSFCAGTITHDELGQKVTRKVVMFANKEKKNENQPDFVLYLSEERDSGSSGSSGSGPASTGPARSAPSPATGPTSGPRTTGPSRPASAPATGPASGPRTTGPRRAAAAAVPAPEEVDPDGIPVEMQ